MKAKHVLPVILLALGVAAGVGSRRFGSENASVPVGPATEAADGAAAKSADEAEAAKGRLAAMRLRIRDLEAKIAACKDADAGQDEIEQDATNDISNAEAVANRPQDLGKSRLEQIMRLKREEPKQFVFRTNDMMRTSRWQKQQAQVRVEYFKRADVSKMTARERAIHEELIGCEEALGRIGEIGGIWDRSAEVENACVAEKKDIKSRIVELYQAEARTLVRLKALELGYSEADTEEIAESVSGLLKATYNTTEYIGKMD